MEKKEYRIKHINTSNIQIKGDPLKKAWKKPSLVNLDINQTMGGGVTGMSEGAYAIGTVS